MDWKEKLSGLKDILPENDEDNIENNDSESSDESELKQKSPLLVVYDRKGRKGKCATIIEGFEIDEAKVKELGADLKKRLGVGGSVKESEILIQGERGPEICKYLTDLGYKVKKQGF